MISTIFVYGTLKRGIGNHGFIAGSEFLGEAVTVGRYALHIDGGLPMVDRDNPVSIIHGEVYQVNEDTMGRLDGLEGHPVWYRRELVTVRLVDDTLVDAWIYFHTAPSGPVESSGVFRAKQR